MPEARLITRLSVQFHVISALMVREVMGRYGRGNLGFLWLIVEPIFLVSGVITVWSFLHPTGAHGVSVAAFVISGYMPLTLWRHLSGAAGLMSGNFGLLYHRRITVSDIMIARALTEVAGVSAAGIVVYFMLLSVGLVDWVADPATMLLGWLTMILFGFGAGCIIAGLSERSEALANLIQPIQYLLMPISGCFFMVTWLPKQAQDYALLVPLVHIYEMFRAGIFGGAVETHYNPYYPIIVSATLIFLGSAAINSSRKKLSAR